MIEFKDRKVADQDKYNLTIDGEVKEVTLVSKKTITEEGTPLNASNLNGNFNELNTLIGKCITTAYSGGITVSVLTQAEYDALTTKDANTLYLIK